MDINKNSLSKGQLKLLMSVIPRQSPKTRELMIKYLNIDKETVDMIMKQNQKFLDAESGFV